MSRWTLLAFAVACSDSSSSALAIQNGTPATAYPEAVVVTANGFVPCSGVLLAPRVVLSAGHCRGSGDAYVIQSPSSGQQVTGSSSWTPFTGDPAKSSDVLLVFLDAPIDIASYPVIADGEVAPGTAVVDIGRTSNGVIGDEVWMSPSVTIQGDAASLGYPFNYQATPDLSEDGDSGGPIMIAGTHTVVAIVDTDTVEQQLDASPPIDLFARLDVVKSDIDAQVERSKTFGTVPAVVTGGCSAAGQARDLSTWCLLLGALATWRRGKRVS